jgi:hypothetical protein
VDGSKAKAPSRATGVGMNWGVTRPMHISDFSCSTIDDGFVLSAKVVWEDRNFPAQELTFEIGQPRCADEVDHRLAHLNPPSLGDDAAPNAFLAGCFPLAAVHGEARLKIDGRPCSMLVEGLRTAHGWWSSWGGMPNRMPAIEARYSNRIDASPAPRRAVSFLSGGVDGLHMLMRNHQLYQPSHPAYIRDAIFIHGFDIGKRVHSPENERYRAALRRLAPIAAETGIRLIACRTNLRHLPSKPGFWADRHNGAALAAVGHAVLRGSAFLFIAASHHLSHPVPIGSHPSVDHLFSSHRIQIIHDGTRFTRLEKVRELARWPAGLAALRVCPEGSEDQANCGRCEKCLRTRLELLAVGVEQTEAFGPSLTPIELWDQAVPYPTSHRAIMYEDLLPALRARGLNALSRALEDRVAIYRGRTADRLDGPFVYATIPATQPIFA